MQKIIEQLAKDTGISIKDAGNIFTAFSGFIIHRIPELNQVIDDVFANLDGDLLQEHINKAIISLQQQESGKFKSWVIPPQQAGIIKHSGHGELF